MIRSTDKTDRRLLDQFLIGQAHKRGTNLALQKLRVEERDEDEKSDKENGEDEKSD